MEEFESDLVSSEEVKWVFKRFTAQKASFGTWLSVDKLDVILGSLTKSRAARSASWLESLSMTRSRCLTMLNVGSNVGGRR